MTEEETMEKVKRVEAAHSGGKKEIEAEEPDVEGADDNIYTRYTPQPAL